MRHSKVEIVENINVGDRKILKYISIIGAILVILLFYFNQHNILVDKVNSIKNVHSIIYGLFIMITIALIISILKNNYKLERLFLMIIIPIGLIYTLLIPPGIVPDEWVHMYSAFSLSSQIMQKETNDQVTMKVEEYELYSRQVTIPDDGYYDYVYNNIFSISDNNEYMNIEVDSVSFGQIFAYFPTTIGVTFARILNLGGVITAYVGRLFNFIYYTIITYFALKKIPFGKLLLFVVTMLPMACHQMFSLSYDAVLNATSFFCIAYGMFFVYQSDKIEKKDIAFYSLGSLILLTVKGSAYAFILVIPILAKYFNPNGYEIAKRTKIIIFIIVITCIVLLNFRSFISTGTTSSLGTVSGENLVPWSGTPSYTLSSLLTDIPGTIMLFINTFIEKGVWYINTAIGSELGWLNILMPTWTINVWIGLLIISSFSEKSNNEVFTYEHKLLYFLIAAAVILVVMLAMALAWTPAGYQWIEGVQGRYYIPIIYLLLIWLQNTKIYLHDKIVKIVTIIIPIMAMISIYNLIPLVL